MPLLDFLTPEAVVASLRVSGKKQALQELAAHAARLTGLDERVVFEALLRDLRPTLLREIPIIFFTNPTEE